MAEESMTGFEGAMLVSSYSKSAGRASWTTKLINLRMRRWLCYFGSSCLLCSNRTAFGKGGRIDKLMTACKLTWFSFLELGTL